MAEEFEETEETEPELTPRVTLMVLSDGTFSEIEGCRIVSVPRDWTDGEIEAALAGEEALNVIATFRR